MRSSSRRRASISFCGSATRQQRRDRPLLLRVVEDAHAIQLGLAHEVAQARERLLGLAGVADDERRAQRRAGHALPHARAQVAHRALAVSAAHRLEHAAVDVLHRHVQVLRDARLARHHVEQPVGARRRIGVVQADPAQPIHPRQLRQQRLQRRARPAPSRPASRCRRSSGPARPGRSPWCRPPPAPRPRAPPTRAGGCAAGRAAWG